MQQRLYEEINEVLDGGKADLDENNIKELKY